MKSRAAKFGSSSAVLLCFLLFSACDRNTVTTTPAAPVAISSVPGPTPVTSAAFEVSPFDPPIRKAEQGDWMVEHPQDPQDFEAYRASEWESPTPSKGTIYLVAIGIIREESFDMERLRRFVAAYYQTRVVVMNAVDPRGRYTIRKTMGVDQILTTDVLDHLAEIKPDDAYVTMAVTSIDLYPGDGWNFVFGQANLNDRVGVFSLARYGDADPKVSLLRAYKVVAHEIGHDFGMLHCQHHSCVMNGANHLEETDASPLNLCPVCLQKLHHVHEHNVLDRYAKLADVLEDDGLAAQAAWYRKRAAWIRERDGGGDGKME